MSTLEIVIWVIIGAYAFLSIGFNLGKWYAANLILNISKAAMKVRNVSTKKGERQ